VGGKRGRHPRLATELESSFSSRDICEVVETCEDYYEACCRSGERLGEILEREGLAQLSQKIKKVKKSC
jgi:dissimilatory sulfite reductase (desulfoviridin) alpha/beta subunit